ncbi:O-antigen polysaccharide polymerase Wzy family protein [[Clostridium] hylemonae]|uniref:O-antigen polysaccharide polymerase Wzy n=1 Tax=[Clostridium] hylemonae DSM 15053 TaxID=553973 RepID=C0C2D6_9FIRM|nr:O-antigen polysaccharide polymerase Wzy family protein [[Clostridium] hylemonae]EEG73560.1 hypothetical protein CLOHYLEM_06242 [[Clostridium] hylemonae DSM 15053]QEK17161.1 hypothetical protein LAJLEIBI_01170 [[Clostridium] hylemonae DSM 15053]
MSKKVSVNCFIRTGILILAFILFLKGWLVSSIPILSISIFLIWLNNIIFSLNNVREKIVFLLFQVAIFTFLISRPLIGTLSKGEWWTISGQAVENFRFAFLVVAIAMVGLYIGALVSGKLLKNNKDLINKGNYEKVEFKKSLQNISLIVFSISAVFYGVQEIEKLVYMAGKTYVQFYQGFSGQMPSFVYLFASFMKYSLCIFLATMPDKRKAFLPLAVFELTAVPQLIIGIRNPLILNSMFILTYYILRDYFEGSSVWLGKIEKRLLCISAPAILILMKIFTNIRGHVQIEFSNVFQMIKDFFDGQGVTFEVLTKCYGWIGNLPSRNLRNYTFGEFIDYIQYGSIGQKIFGTSPLPDYNCEANGLLSNKLSHNLAYAMDKDSYLAGRGWGSSFILENYIDFGYIGVIIFSVLLGMVLIAFVKKFNTNIILNVIILVSITSIYFMPRAEATGWLLFIITFRFWACIIMCYFLTWVYRKYISGAFIRK